MALPTSIFILLKNLTYMEVTGAGSVTLDDAGNVVEVYDMDTHRNLFDAGSIGRAWTDDIANGPSAAVVEGTIASNALTWDDQPVEKGPLSPEGLDDRVSKTAPTPTMKQRTMIIWWSGPTGTGDQLAMCWSDQFIGYSGTAPRFVQ